MPRPVSRYSRWRAASLLTVYVLMGLHIAHWKLTGRTLTPLEFNEVLHTIHLGIVTAGFVFMTVAVLATSLFGRFFCSWGCHILALEDLSAWLLGRMRIHPKPLRSRVLLWVPCLAMAHLFVWPQIERMLRGGAPPPLRVVADPAGWTSFVTSDLWRNLPGPWISALSFLVCGFVIVYLLGSRSFCRYVCPYGAIFAGADHLAPGRIVAVGDCSRCGLCTAVCRSHVRVQEEVLRSGTVIDPSCLRDLDCVSVCPDRALRFGFTRPPLLRSRAERRRSARNYDFSAHEDIAMAAVFTVAFLVSRGLYDAVPYLLALALAALAAFVAVACARLVRDNHLNLGGVVMKSAGRVTACGRAFAAVAALLAALLAHSAFIRGHELLGGRAFAELARGEASDRTLAAALSHLETLQRFGLVRPTSLRRRLASLYLLTGAAPAAEKQLRAVLAREPGDRRAQRWLGELLARRRQPTPPDFR